MGVSRPSLAGCTIAVAPEPESLLPGHDCRWVATRRCAGCCRTGGAG